jgi:zinc-ribbon domain
MAGGIYALIAVLFGIATGMIGRGKGSSFWIWFVIGAVLPVFGVIAALLYRNEHTEPERRCPRCGAVHKIHVQVCTSCGLDMDLPEVEDVRPGPAYR